MYYRSSIDNHPWKRIGSSCCVKSVAELPNGYLLGVGLDHHVYIRNKMWGRWYQKLPHSAAVKSIATTKTGKLYGVGMNNKIYVKQGNVYSHWRGPLGHSCCVIDISFGSDGYLYGVGTNYRYVAFLERLIEGGGGGGGTSLLSDTGCSAQWMDFSERQIIDFLLVHLPLNFKKPHAKITRITKKSLKENHVVLKSHKSRTLFEK